MLATIARRPLVLARIAVWRCPSQRPAPPSVNSSSCRIATWIMLATSWQMTYRVLAVALLAVALPLSAIFLRDAPPARSAAGEMPCP